jgi:hypothetical protein
VVTTEEPICSWRESVPRMAAKRLRRQGAPSASEEHVLTRQLTAP